MKLKLNYFKSLFVLLLFVTNSVSAQQLTLSNNLLYDATLTPNLRLGVRLSPHWSLGLTAGYRPWPTDDQATRKYKHLLISPDLRYWTDSVNVHHFFGFNAIYAHYNVGSITFPLGFWKSVRDERQQGDFVGIGAFYGYSWPLGRHWNFEAFIGAAVGYNKYDRYECAHCGSKLGTEKKVGVLPQAGLNIVYNIPGRPRQVEEPVLQLQPVVEAPVTAAVVVKPFAPALTAIPDFKGRAGQLQQENPVVQHISNYRPYDRTRILRKEKDALFVHFDQGKSLLNANYRDNQRVMERIVDITRQIMSDSASSVKKVPLSKATLLATSAWPKTALWLCRNIFNRKSPFPTHSLRLLAVARHGLTSVTISTTSPQVQCSTVLPSNHPSARLSPSSTMSPTLSPGSANCVASMVVRRGNTSSSTS